MVPQLTLVEWQDIFAPQKSTTALSAIEPPECCEQFADGLSSANRDCNDYMTLPQSKDAKTQGMIGMAERNWRQLLILLVMLGIIGATIYWPGMRGKYFADDYQVVFAPVPSDIFHFFVHQNPHHNFAYRPLQATFLLLVQKQFGMSTWPIHYAQLGLHVLISWLVFIWMRRVGLSNQASLLGSLFMLVSQVNVSAVAGNDTFSQVSSALFGCGSLWSFYAYCQRSVTKSYLISVSAFALALLAKENSIGYVLPLGLMAWFCGERCALSVARVKAVAVRLLPFLAILVLYLGLRSMVGVRATSEDESTYAIGIGVGNVQNLALFVGAAILPRSTVDMFIAGAEARYVTILLFVTEALLFALLVILGLWLCDRRKLPLIVCFFALIVVLPMTLFKHVSELYVYNAMPLLAIPVGVGLDRILNTRGKRKILHFLVVSILLLMLGNQMSAVRSKATMMKENGEKSEVLLHQIVPLTDKVPEGGQLLLVNPDSMGVEYSVFLMRGFNVLSNGEHQINVLSGRSDFKISILTEAELARIGHTQSSVALRLAENQSTVFLERW